MFAAKRKVLRLRVEQGDLKLAETSEEAKRLGAEARKHSEEAKRHREKAEQANGFASALRDGLVEDRNQQRKLQRQLDALEQGGLSEFEAKIGGGEGQPRKQKSGLRVRGLNG